jgi:hypothetical protein
MAILGPGDNLLFQKLHRDEEKKRERGKGDRDQYTYIANFYYPTTRGRGGENSGLFLIGGMNRRAKKNSKLND